MIKFAIGYLVSLFDECNVVLYFANFMLIRSFRQQADWFEAGEFQEQVQFVYGEKLQRIKFRYTGPSIEAVLDRLPTAEIVQKDSEGWVVSPEVFGQGIEIWLRSQRDYIDQTE